MVPCIDGTIILTVGKCGSSKAQLATDRRENKVGPRIRVKSCSPDAIESPVPDIDSAVIKKRFGVDASII